LKFHLLSPIYEIIRELEVF